MRTLFRAFTLVGFVAALPAGAVYAPVPEPEVGKDLLVTLKSGISHDSNLFGAASGEVSSMIYSFAPRVAYQRSLTAQTYFSSAYGLTLEHFENRPGDKLLDSHEASVRLAHAFSKTSNIDLNNLFMVSRNPESLLAGIPLNPDQSFTRNQLDGRFVTPVSPKITATAKARSVYIDYRNATLGRSLDRIENLFGIAADYAVLPELKSVAELRQQEVYYSTQGEVKNKSSTYAMAGFDYEAARKLLLTARGGVEWRRRAAERDVTAPYAELSARYHYTERSFLTGGYAYMLEETSDTTRFNDSQVHRMFANVQHAITALIVASGSLTYEPAELKGRRGVADISEDTVRVGAAISYLPTRNWTVSASYDYDRANSDDPIRDMRRERVALNAVYSF